MPFELPASVASRLAHPDAAPPPPVEIVLIVDWPAYRALHPELEFTGTFDIQGRAIFHLFHRQHSAKGFDMTTHQPAPTDAPTSCPACGSSIVRTWKSESLESDFIEFGCGLKIANQSGRIPRGWKVYLSTSCRNFYNNPLGYSAVRLRADNERLRGEVAQTRTQIDWYEDELGYKADLATLRARLEACAGAARDNLDNTYRKNGPSIEYFFSDDLDTLANVFEGLGHSVKSDLLRVKANQLRAALRGETETEK